MNQNKRHHFYYIFQIIISVVALEIFKHFVLPTLSITDFCLCLVTDNRNNLLFTIHLAEEATAVM